MSGKVVNNGEELTPLATLRHNFKLHLLAKLFRLADGLGVQRLQSLLSLHKLIKARDEVIEYFLEALSEGLGASDIVVNIDSRLFKPLPQVFVRLVQLLQLPFDGGLETIEVFWPLPRG